METWSSRNLQVERALAICTLKSCHSFTLIRPTIVTHPPLHLPNRLIGTRIAPLVARVSYLHEAPFIMTAGMPSVGISAHRNQLSGQRSASCIYDRMCLRNNWWEENLRDRWAQAEFRL